MAKIPFEQRQRVLREVYRHYADFKDHVSRTGQHFIAYGPLLISFSDLKNGVNSLSERKKEAFFLNVILDKKQKECAEIMGIKMVSVGQYVEAACQQLAVQYFSEMSDETVEQYVDAFGEGDEEPQPPVSGTPDEETERRRGRRYTACFICGSPDLVGDWPGQTGGDFAHMEDRPHRVCWAHHDQAKCAKCFKHAPHSFVSLGYYDVTDEYTAECECGWHYTAGDGRHAEEALAEHIESFEEDAPEADEPEPVEVPVGVISDGDHGVT